MIGSFVTTSFFTKGVQAEVNEDQYPIMLLNGKKNPETGKSRRIIKRYSRSILLRISAGFTEGMVELCMYTLRTMM